MCGRASFGTVKKLNYVQSILVLTWLYSVSQLENYFIFNDRYRGMRMDIDGMSYEVC